MLLKLSWYQFKQRYYNKFGITQSSWKAARTYSWPLKNKSLNNTGPLIHVVSIVRNNTTVLHDPELFESMDARTLDIEESRMAPEYQLYRYIWTKEWLTAVQVEGAEGKWGVNAKDYSAISGADEILIGCTSLWIL